MEETGLNLIPKWALCGDYEDTRLLKAKLGDRATIYDWTQTCKDVIEADIAYGYLVGVNDLKHRFGTVGQWLDYPPLRCQVYYAHWKDQIFQRQQNFRFLPLSMAIDYVKAKKDWATFVRPDSNNKGFTGGIWEPRDLEQFMGMLGPETLCVVANGVNMENFQEYRCFMRAGKFITGSSYKLLDNGEVESHNIDERQDIIDYVENNFPVYPDLPELYALDVVEGPGGYKHKWLMELTCWSCAGLYNIDLDKYIKTTEEAWEDKLKEYEV